MDIIARRKNLQTEITNKDLEGIVNKGKDTKKAANVEEQDEACKQMVPAVVLISA